MQENVTEKKKLRTYCFYHYCYCNHFKQNYIFTRYTNLTYMTEKTLAKSHFFEINKNKKKKPKNKM